MPVPYEKSFSFFYLSRFPCDENSKIYLFALIFLKAQIVSLLSSSHDPKLKPTTRKLLKPTRHAEYSCNSVIPIEKLLETLQMISQTAAILQLLIILCPINILVKADVSKAQFAISSYMNW